MLNGIFQVNINQQAQKRSVDELVAFFNKLGKAGFKAEPMIFAANEDYVIDAHRGWSIKVEDGKNVDLN